MTVTPTQNLTLTFTLTLNPTLAIGLGLVLGSQPYPSLDFYQTVAQYFVTPWHRHMPRLKHQSNAKGTFATFQGDTTSSRIH